MATFRFVLDIKTIASLLRDVKPDFSSILAIQCQGSMSVLSTITSKRIKRTLCAVFKGLKH